MCCLIRNYLCFTIIITLSSCLKTSLSQVYETEFDYDSFAKEDQDVVNTNVTNTDQKKVVMNVTELPEEDTNKESETPQTFTESDIEGDITTVTTVTTNEPIAPTTTITTIKALKPVFKPIVNKRRKKPILKTIPNIQKKVPNRDSNRHNVQRVWYHRQNYFPTRTYLVSYYYYYPLHHNHNLIYIPYYKTYGYYTYYYVPLHQIRRFYVPYRLQYNNYHLTKHGFGNNNNNN